MKMIRVLNPTEYKLIEPILAQHGTSSPDPTNSRIVIAQDKIGSVLGFSVLQPAWHLEPIWVTISERGSGLWEELMTDQVRLLERDGTSMELYAFSPRPAIERLLERRLGFSKLDWKIMSRRIVPSCGG